MATSEMQIAQLIWQVRRLFQRMASESNDLLTCYGITASQRAVLQFLDHNEPETLVNMARAHDVSRQHIQQIANELLAKGLVETVENPHHKRSFLLQRTKAGNALFNEIKRTETELFARIAEQFDNAAVQTTVSTLLQLNDYLHSENWLDIKRRYTQEETKDARS